MAETKIYPSTIQVGSYLNRFSFSAQRLSVASWVHNEEMVDLVLQGKFCDIKPLHFEVEVTSRCNFNCSWCNCASSRKKLANLDMTLEQMKHIINQCSIWGSGIQWTGGEPLMNKDIIVAIKYASEKQLNQCIFTNGSLLENTIINDLLTSNLKFIRISLNCFTDEVHSKYHGNISTALTKRVKINCEQICRMKILLNSSVQLGFSIVLDDRNIDDCKATINFLHELSSAYSGAIDYVVIRPVNTDLLDTVYSLSPNFACKYNSVINNEIYNSFLNLNVKLIFPYKDSAISSQSKECLGCQTFSEIAPNGNVFLCSDKYGDCKYVIGNIFNSSLGTIYQSDFYKSQREKCSQCFAIGSCPHSSRGYYFNSIFNQIKQLQLAGEAGTVISWINALRKTIAKTDHTFYI